MNWLRLEHALEVWSAWYRPRLGRVMGGRRPMTPEEVAAGVVVLEFHAEEQALYEAIDCKVEDLRLAARVDALERLYEVVKAWSETDRDTDEEMRATDEMIDIVDELEKLKGH
jgi:uncharacterized Ntn-hydrolase superfamily protein